MGYADLDAVRVILKLGAEGDDPDADARLASLDAALSALFEEKVGRTWQADAVAARTVAVPITLGYGSSVATLPPPGIRSLVSLSVGAEWDGETWSGGEAVDLTEAVPVWQTDDGAYQGLLLGAGWPWWAGAWYAAAWSSTLLVEAVWADTVEGVPVEVTEALTFLVAEEYKQERASPESLLGPDGFAIPTRNPWRFERVTAAIDRHKVPTRVVV